MQPISIVIPLRVDSDDRAKNLHCVIQQLLQMDFVSIDILEADKVQRFFIDSHNRIRYRFIYDEETVFYRTKYLNLLLKNATNNIVGVWDTDVLIPREQIQISIEMIEKGCVMCFPYDGRFLFISPKESEKVRADLRCWKQEVEKPLIGRPSVGGAFIVNRDQYIAVGGENEGFYGWGPEDVERVKRLEILELPIGRVKGALFHLHHERKGDLGIDNKLKKLHNLKVLMQTCRMSKMELEKIIYGKE